MDKENEVHIHKGKLPHHKKELNPILPFATTWMDPESFMLSDVS